jgi:hypothetical protein
MKLAVILLIASACFVAALAAYLPATFIDRRLAAVSAAKLRLANATGTIWDGSGVLTDAGGNWRLPLGWSISKAAVARGVHEAVLRPVDSSTTPQGVVEAIGDGFALRNVALELPASSLLSVSAARGLPAVGGTLALSSPAFAWSDGESKGTLNAQWRGARLVVGDAVADLGTVDLTVTPQGTGLGGRLTNSGGDVRIEGTVALASSALSVDATVAPAAGAPLSIARALTALGTPEPSGSVRIVWRGSLR